jgi:hypothetical protein
VGLSFMRYCRLGWGTKPNTIPMMPQSCVLGCTSFNPTYGL